nr:putative monoglyceride lipase [Quercus suber]
MNKNSTSEGSVSVECRESFSCEELSRPANVIASHTLLCTCTETGYFTLRGTQNTNMAALPSTPVAVQTTESNLLTADKKVELYTKTWHTPSQPPQARLVFIHGFSDHCNFYEPFFSILAARGIKVYAFDQRGWGRSVHSPAQKGLTGYTPVVLDDVTHFIRSEILAHEAERQESSVPLFVAGHSMGGGITLTYAATGPSDVVSRVRGWLVESPWVALAPAAQPWKLTVVAGRLASKVLPGMQLPQHLPPENVCRDPAVAKQYIADDLCHDTGTLAGLAGCLDRAAALQEGKVVLREGRGEGGKTRLWFGHGTKDLICAYDACKGVYERAVVADKKMRTYEGWYHKLHTEPGEDKQTFANDFGNWILERSGSEVDKAKL